MKRYIPKFNKVAYNKLSKKDKKLWSMGSVKKRIGFYENKYTRDEYISDFLFEDFNLEESSLSRVYTHFKKGGFIIGSAFKLTGIVSDEENIRRHKLLLKWLKSKNLGFFVIDGVWEDPKTKEKYPELSVFVPYIGIKNMTYEKFLNLALHWAKKGKPENGNFDQGCILVKDPDITVDYHNLFLLTKKGVVKKLRGIFKPDQIAEIYSKFKSGKHVGRTFIFEGIQTYDMGYNRQLMIEEGYIFL